MKRFKLRENYGMTFDQVLDQGQKLKESTFNGLDLSSLGAIYPLIWSITADKLTKNDTNYSKKSMLDSKQYDGKATGFRSFIDPYGRPVITNHDQYDGSPIGRVIWAGYKSEKDPDPVYKPGTELTYKGVGYMPLIAAITCPEAIGKVLRSEYNTVSIGTTAHSIINSISGKDVIEQWNAGEDIYEYIKGQYYDDQYCYWDVRCWTADEISYVNVPADHFAHTVSKDLGSERVQLLLADGASQKEFVFYDFFTQTKVDLSECFATNEFVMDRSFIIPSDSKPVWNVGIDSKKEKDIENFKKLQESAKNLLNSTESDPGDETDSKNDPITLDAILDEVLKNE